MGGNIFIKNLPLDFDHEKLYKTFNQFGTILSCKVAMKDGSPLGYGFVHFQEEKSAQAAIKAKDGMVVDGQKQPLSVAPFKSKGERGASINVTNLYIKNLPKGPDFDEEKLCEMFKAFGKITSSKLAVSEDGKESKGFGFINFDDTESAKKAIDAMHEKEFEEKKLYVAAAQPKAIRMKMLKQQHEKEKLSRSSKFAGTNL